MCKPGYRYPPWQYGPFLGIEIDSATEEEYRNGFDCVPVERMYKHSVDITNSYEIKHCQNLLLHALCTLAVAVWLFVLR